MLFLCCVQYFDSYCVVSLPGTVTIYITEYKYLSFVSVNQASSQPTHLLHTIMTIEFNTLETENFWEAHTPCSVALNNRYYICWEQKWLKNQVVFTKWMIIKNIKTISMAKLVKILC